MPPTPPPSPCAPDDILDAYAINHPEWRRPRKRLTQRAQVVLPELSQDLWVLIVGAETHTSFRARLLSKWFCRLVDESNLVDLESPTGTCTQKQLCERLLLKPAEAQRLPFDCRQLSRYAEAYIFDLATCVPLAFDIFGADEILKRKHARFLRIQKSDSLPERKKKALESRLAKLSVWWEAHSNDLHWSKPSEWKEWMHTYNISNSTTIDVFFKESVSAPSFGFVTNYIQNQSTRVKALLVKLEANGLHLRDDSRICKAYLQAAPICGFETPTEIAHEMAFMRWLHEHTDYEMKVECMVQELRAQNDSRYYCGIYSDARHLAKREFDAPKTWPWM